MKFEIPFVEKIYTKQTKLNFDLTWKNRLWQHRFRLIMGLLMILIGIYMITKEKYFGYALIGFGIHNISDFLGNLLNYRKSRKEFSNSIKIEISQQANFNKNTIWEFNDEEFHYKDHKLDTKIKWFVFTGYRIIDLNLFLDINMGPTLSYIISEDEIGKEKFEMLIKLVKEKLG